MSDSPTGPGWWQASDGKWYPLGQSTRQELDLQRPGVARPKPKGSEGRYIAIVFAVALAVALWVYGPTHMARLQRMLSDGGAPVAAPGSPAAGSLPVSGLPASAGGREAVLEVMSQGWDVLPGAERKAFCEESRQSGADRAAAELSARLFGDPGAAAGFAGPELPAQFLAIACAEVEAGG